MKTQQRKRTISLDHAATSIQVTPDAQPLLFTTNVEHSGVHVYDAASGEHRHHVDGVAVNPLLFWQVRP
jgi:hypothetical protein